MFANHFSRTFSGNNASRVNMLKQEYMALRANYSGFPLIDKLILIPSWWVYIVILDLKCGKATDINGLSAENLQSSKIIDNIIKNVSPNTTVSSDSDPIQK